MSTAKEHGDKRDGTPNASPVAWMVFTSGPAEYEYLVYADEDAANHQAVSHETEAIPLYRAEAFTPSHVERITPAELEHLIEWHDACAKFSSQSDNFSGETHHEARAAALRKVDELWCDIGARSAPSTTPQKAGEPLYKDCPDCGYSDGEHSQPCVVGKLERELAEANAGKVKLTEMLAEEMAASVASAPLLFTLEVCEELFGCFVSPSGERGFECAICDKNIDIKAWVHAEHEPDCIINRVRDYLATHKPEVVRSRGVDWMRTADGGNQTDG